ncbi:hypothetical protein RB195_016981 [Necator americanus]|uniref:Uncharacterized protein n=1 Tax=Necator americanus TaxID=51031 RepID=A0ABR1C6R0_NECAM
MLSGCVRKRKAAIFQHGNGMRPGQWMDKDEAPRRFPKLNMQSKKTMRDHHRRETLQRAGRNAPETPTYSLGVSEQKRHDPPTPQCLATHFKGSY